MILVNPLLPLAQTRLLPNLGTAPISDENLSVTNLGASTSQTVPRSSATLPRPGLLGASSRTTRVVTPLRTTTIPGADTPQNLAGPESEKPSVATNLEAPGPKRVATALERKYEASVATSGQAAPKTPDKQASSKAASLEVEKNKKKPVPDTPERGDCETIPSKAKGVVRNETKVPISPATRKTEAESLPKVHPVNLASDKEALSSPTTTNKPGTLPHEVRQESRGPPASKDAVERSQRPHPGTIRITTPVIENNSISGASQASPTAPRVSESQPKPSRTSSTAIPSTSRPETPTVVEQPIRRPVQPKTLRITDTPKAETPPPMAPSQSTGTPTGQGASSSKVGSRRPSMTSTAQPSTPMSERVDLASVASASRTESRTESRAASPGPVAGKKRSEKSKAKKQQQKKSQEQETVAPPVVEERSPVMSRKRKTNKPVSASAIPNKAASKSASRPQSPVEDNAEVEPEKDLATVESKTLSKEEDDQPVTQTTEESEIPAPKPKKPENILEGLVSNFDELLNHPLFRPISSTSYTKNIPAGRPFTTPEEFQHFGGFEYNYDYHPNRVPHDYPSSKPFTEEQHNTYIAAHIAANEPIRLVTRDGRVSGKYIETPHGTRVPYLTDEEQERLCKLETDLASHSGPGIWGGGNPFWLPNGAVLKNHSRYSAQNGLPSLPKGVSRLVNNREVQPRDPDSLINTFVMATEVPVDPRRLATQDQQHVPPLPPQQTASQYVSRSYEHYSGTTAGATASTPPRPSTTLHPIDPLRLEASSSSGGSGSNAAMQHDPETAAMFDKLDRVAGGAKKAAAAIGGTHEILRRAMGGPDDELARLAEQMEAEKKKAAELEKALNALSKKNRKSVMAARG
jgi:hypothetical protein